MKIIDAHSHVDYISHVNKNNVIGTICCSTNEKQWIKLINIINNNNRIYGAFGIHPWFVNTLSLGFDHRLYNLLLTNDNYMIGEIGLDKYKPNLSFQKEVFKKQFEIAIKLHRSVSIHCVGAWDTFFNVLKQYKQIELPLMLVHDFHGSKEILSQLLNNYNIMFSFNKINKPEYIEQIPDNKIMVESDGNKDINLSDVVNRISDIKHNLNMSNIIYTNTQRFLKYE